MRKLLILMLILGMVSLANAGLIDVVIDTPNGGWVDTNGNGVIDASDIINIKITTSLSLAAFDIGLGVFGPGILQDYGIDHVDSGGMWYYSGIVDNAIATMTDVTFFAGMTGDLVWGLQIECAGPGTVNVNLTTAPGGTYDTGGYVVTPADLGHLVITQVPEPATLLLLGLGSLALRKQRFGFRRSRLL